MYNPFVASEEISAAVCDDKPERAEMARLYNEVYPSAVM